ncbi:DUF953 domain protein [Xylariomycetidae sp. FL2044]|nr:DUF953 domain protein [Xylariomycetidae sp. FL2044]
MPVRQNITVPSSPDQLVNATPLLLSEEDQAADNNRIFLAFVSSDDPSTGKPWCPDVRAALPHLERAFGGGPGEKGPSVGIVHVGQRPAWKDAANIYRTHWNVHNVPSLVRYERDRDGKVVETGRLVEGELLDDERILDFIGR